MESEGMEEDSPVNTQQNACIEPISSQTEWSASGMPCLRQSSNQSLLTIHQKGLRLLIGTAHILGI